MAKVTLACPRRFNQRQEQKRQEVIKQTQTPQFMQITHSPCASLAFQSALWLFFHHQPFRQISRRCLVTIPSITSASPHFFFNARSCCTPCFEVKPGQDRRRFVTIIQVEMRPRSLRNKKDNGYQFRVVRDVLCEFLGPHITNRSCLMSCMPKGM